MALTHALELVFEVRLVVAVGDVEVEVRVVLLVEHVGRDSSAHGQHSGRTVGSLHFAGDIGALGGAGDGHAGGMRLQLVLS